MRHGSFLLVLAAFAAIGLAGCSRNSPERLRVGSAITGPWGDAEDLRAVALAESSMSWGQVKHHFEDYTQAPPPDSACGPPPEW